MKALAGYVICEPIKETETASPAGIYYPPSKDRPVKGRVLDVGMDISLVKAGEVVWHRRWSGDEIKVGEKEYRIIKIEDVMAKE